MNAKKTLLKSLFVFKVILKGIKTSLSGLPELYLLH